MLPRSSRPKGLHCDRELPLQLQTFDLTHIIARKPFDDRNTHKHAIDHAQFRIRGGLDFRPFEPPAALDHDVYFVVAFSFLNAQYTYAFGAKSVLQRSFEWVSCDLVAENVDDVAGAPERSSRPSSPSSLSPKGRVSIVKECASRDLVIEIAAEAIETRTRTKPSLRRTKHCAGLVNHLNLTRWVNTMPKQIVADERRTAKFVLRWRREPHSLARQALFRRRQHGSREGSAGNQQTRCVVAMRRTFGRTEKSR